MTVPVDQQQNQTQNDKQSEKEYNFNALRKKYEQESAARQMAEERASNLERELREREETKRSRYEEEEESSEPYVDHKTLDRKLSRYQEMQNKKIQQTAKEIAHEMLQEEKKNQFFERNQDFDEVMNEEVLNKFADNNKEIAESILKMPASFERQKLLYATIKRLGLHKKEENKIQETINRNQRNPGLYMNSGASTPPYGGNFDSSPANQKAAFEKMKALQQKMRLG